MSDEQLLLLDKEPICPRCKRRYGSNPLDKVHSHYDGKTMICASCFAAEHMETTGKGYMSDVELTFKYPRWIDSNEPYWEE